MNGTSWTSGQNIDTQRNDLGARKNSARIHSSAGRVHAGRERSALRVAEGAG